MTIEHAIKKACIGGWKELYIDAQDGITVDHSQQIAWGRTSTNLGRHLPLAVIFLDPAFWKALGKAEGWDKYDPDDVSHDCDALGCSSIEHRIQGCWRIEMHRLMDALADEKSIEEYFETL
jgi:hypothetical protein